MNRRPSPRFSRTVTGLAKGSLRDALLRLIAMSLAGAGFILRRRWPGWQARQPIPTPNNVLLLRLDLLGDVVFSLPVANMLKQRFPGTRITMVTLPQTSAVALASPDVDGVIAIDTNLVRSPATLMKSATRDHVLAGLQSLRSQHFDVALSLYGRTASLLALLSRSGIRAGYASEAYPSTLDLRVPGGRVTDRSRRHDSQLNLDLLDHVIQPREPAMEARPRLEIKPEAEATVRELLSHEGIEESDPLVVLHCGSSYGDFKRWPSGNFRELALRLSAEGAALVVIGSHQEEELAASVAADSPAMSLAGKTTLPELIALLDRATLIVSGDSGPLHMATALGTPAIGIYGPTDPLVNGPIGWKGQTVEVLRGDIPCSPCYSVRTRDDCPLYEQPLCMHLVTVDSVLHSARKVLASRSPA